MRRGGWRWVLGGLLCSLIGTAGPAWADRIYLKDGTSVWGEFAEDLGGFVRIFSRGHTLEFPKEKVIRVEFKRTNMPDYQVATPPPPPPPSSGEKKLIPGGSPVGSGGTTSGGCRSGCSRR